MEKGLVDVSYFGNHELIRNVLHDDVGVHFTGKWKIPTSGRVKLDFTSMKGPDVQRDTISSEDLSGLLAECEAAVADVTSVTFAFSAVKQQLLKRLGGYYLDCAQFQEVIEVLAPLRPPYVGEGRVDIVHKL